MGIAAAVGLAPALILLALALVARARSRRLPASPGPRFSPMPGATVLQDALMLDADQRAIPAVLMDLAVSRRIRLLTDDSPGGRRKALGIEITPNARLSTDEIRVLEALFGQGSTGADAQVQLFLSDRDEIRRRLKSVFEPAIATLQAARMFRAGRRVWVVGLLKAFAWLLLLIDAIFILGTFANGDTVPAVIFVVSAAAAVSVLFVAPRPWRTFLPAADPVRSHLMGMREYMQLAEADQLRMLQSTQGALLSNDVSPAAQDQRLARFHLHERLLPYAVLFGIEKSWAQELKALSPQFTEYERFSQVADTVDEVVEAVELVAGVMHAVGGAIRVVGGAARALDLLDF